MTSVTCSWCHTINDVSQIWCKTCGHSAIEPRDQCDCRTCLGVLYSGPDPDTLPPVTVLTGTKTRHLIAPAPKEDTSNDQ